MTVMEKVVLFKISKNIENFVQLQKEEMVVDKESARETFKKYFFKMVIIYPIFYQRIDPSTFFCSFL